MEGLERDADPAHRRDSRRCWRGGAAVNPAQHGAKDVDLLPRRADRHPPLVIIPPSPGFVNIFSHLHGNHEARTVCRVYVECYVMMRARTPLMVVHICLRMIHYVCVQYKRVCWYVWRASVT